VANTFTFADEQGESLSSPARLDKLITVVDSKNILADSAICQVFIAITWLNTSETGGPPSRMQP
jgi:G3E family GTPase